MKKKISWMLVLLLLCGMASQAQDYSMTRIKSFSDKVEFKMESCIRDASANTATLVYYLKSNLGKSIRMDWIGSFFDGGECVSRVIDDRANSYYIHYHELNGEKAATGDGSNNRKSYRIYELTLPPNVWIKGTLVIAGLNPAARSCQVLNIGFTVIQADLSREYYCYGFTNLPLYTAADLAEFERQKQVGETQEMMAKAEGGDAAAQYELAVRYRNGEGVMENPASAFEWYGKSAGQGHVPAMKGMGDCYYYGIGTTQNYGEALTWYEKAAARGDAEAQYMLGDIYIFAQGVPKDIQKAIQYFEKASIGGSVLGKMRMGEMFYLGFTGEPDYQRAYPLFADAAQQGNALAQYYLGQMYYFGRSVQKNHEKAVEWFEKSAAQSDHRAEDYLGWCYVAGYGVKQDVNKGVEWLEKSVAGGNTEAMNDLGDVYSVDKYGRKNLTKAVSYWNQAAEKNDADGLAKMGNAYQTGAGERVIVSGYESYRDNQVLVLD
jgi:TPR repeat protein